MWSAMTVSLNHETTAEILSSNPRTRLAFSAVFVRVEALDLTGEFRLNNRYCVYPCCQFRDAVSEREMMLKGAVQARAQAVVQVSWMPGPNS
jgi:hypothetical protein